MMQDVVFDFVQLCFPVLRHEGVRWVVSEERELQDRESWTHGVLLLSGKDLRYRRRDERNRRFILNVQVLRSQDQDERTSVVEYLSDPGPGQTSDAASLGMRSPLTISPMRTTFSPLTRNTPRGMSAKVLVGGWCTRSYEPERTRLAEQQGDGERIQIRYVRGKG